MVALHALIGTSHRLPLSKEGSRAAQTSFPTGTFAHNVAAVAALHPAGGSTAKDFFPEKGRRCAPCSHTTRS